MVSLAFLPSIPQEHPTSHTDCGLTEIGWGKANVRGEVGAGCFENSHTEGPVGQSCLHQAVSGTGLALVSLCPPHRPLVLTQHGQCKPPLSTPSYILSHTAVAAGVGGLGPLHV